MCHAQRHDYHYCILVGCHSFNVFAEQLLEIGMVAGFHISAHAPRRARAFPTMATGACYGAGREAAGLGGN
jgi:hypothetical protein